MTRTGEHLRRDALDIWQAGLAAVRSDVLVRENVHVTNGQLQIGDASIDLDQIRHIEVVGAGKAGAGMSAGLEAALGEPLMAQKHLSGWVHVPADCVRPLTRIHLHAARPASVNEPTQAGVDGAEEILRRVAALETEDLCIALISGGGSALLPCPAEGITLADKLAVTRFLSAEGAPIDELNTVRKQLSRIKGGGLARACGAGRLITLVISDVLGDPLDLIASGPTVPDRSTPHEALAILERYGARKAGISTRVFDLLTSREARSPAPIRCQVSNLVIGSNRVAVEAAAQRAAELGYAVTSESATASEGPAEGVGVRLAEAAIKMLGQSRPQCLVSGGEPTVKLVDAAKRGLGGRNQQLVLTAVVELQRRQGNDAGRGLVILSAGTDGEDGPTDAAGAIADEQVIAAARRLQRDPSDYLATNDAYHWFEPTGGLIKTGPTDTNVCDVRVVVAGE